MRDKRGERRERREERGEMEAPVGGVREAEGHNHLVADDVEAQVELAQPCHLWQARREDCVAVRRRCVGEHA
tara:strand:- start:453 stop:668 length:216 start_codon:yes stop_codon:yes gene_type:complete